MRIVKVKHLWKIEVSTHIFFGLIPYRKYLQQCDGAADVSGCSDLVFLTAKEATDYREDYIKTRNRYYEGI